jgi:hypothetical protein
MSKSTPSNASAMSLIAIGMSCTAIGSTLSADNKLKLPLLILAVIIVIYGFVLAVLNLKKAQEAKKQAQK